MFSVANMMPKADSKPRPLHYHIALQGINQIRFGTLCKTIFFVSLTLGFIISIFGYQGNWYTLIPYKSIPILLSTSFILLLRKKFMHVDSKYSSSLFIGFWNGLFNVFFKIYSVYLASAWILFLLLRFSMWNIPLRISRASADVVPDLNEQHVYMLFLTYVLSAAYASTHVAWDYDLVRFPLAIKRHRPPRQRLWDLQKDILFLAVLYSFVLSLVSPLIYWIFRGRVWSFSIFITSLIWQVNSIGYPPSFPITFRVWWCSFYSFLFVTWLWEFSNAAFGIYMALGPTTHGNKLVSERSPDPNGTLLTGLTADKRRFTKCVAFQELLHISVYSPQRRQDLFAADVSSPPSMWTKTSTECLKIIEAAVSHLKKPAPKKTEAKKEEIVVSDSPISKITLKYDSKIFGSKPGSKESRAPSKKYQDIEGRQSAEFIQYIQSAASSFASWLREYLVFVDVFLLSPIGAPFRCTIERQLSQAFPTPGLVTNAILALSSLVCNSRQDDQYGVVQRDIASVMETLDDLITALDGYIEHPPIHWSDARVRKGLARPDMRRADEIVRAAESAFASIVERFSDCLDNLKLSQKVIQRVQTTIMILTEDQDAEDYIMS